MSVLLLMVVCAGCRPQWRTFTAPDGSFRVLLPVEPEEIVSAEGPWGIFVSFHSYIAIPFRGARELDSAPSLSRNLGILWGSAQQRISNRHAAYFVGYGELESPSVSATETLRRFREDLLRDPPLRGDTTCHGTALREVSLDLEGHPGLEVTFDEECVSAESDDPIVSRYRIRVYRVGTRVFVVEVMSAAGAVEERATDDAQRFFDSFELLSAERRDE